MLVPCAEYHRGPWRHKSGMHHLFVIDHTDLSYFIAQYPLVNGMGHGNTDFSMVFDTQRNQKAFGLVFSPWLLPVGHNDKSNVNVSY